MVLLERIELSTSPLPRECSTSELQQQRERASKRGFRGAQGRNLKKCHLGWISFGLWSRGCLRPTGPIGLAALKQMA